MGVHRFHGNAMALSYSQVGVENYDKTNITYHEYKFSANLCRRSDPICTIENISPIVDYASAPKITAKGLQKLENGKQILIGGNPIYHSSSYKDGTFTNQTLAAHVFHSGTVESKLVWHGNTLRLETIGYGYGADVPRAVANYAIGYAYFAPWQQGVKVMVQQANNQMLKNGGK